MFAAKLLHLALLLLLLHCCCFSAGNTEQENQKTWEYGSRLLEYEFRLKEELNRTEGLFENATFYLTWFQDGKSFRILLSEGIVSSRTIEQQTDCHISSSSSSTTTATVSTTTWTSPSGNQKEEISSSRLTGNTVQENQVADKNWSPTQDEQFLLVTVCGAGVGILLLAAIFFVWRQCQSSRPIKIYYNSNHS